MAIELARPHKQSVNNAEASVVKGSWAVKLLRDVPVEATSTLMPIESVRLIVAEFLSTPRFVARLIA